MRVLGLMSGTSLDGIDAALADLRPGADGEILLTPLGHTELAWPDALRGRLLAASAGHALGRPAVSDALGLSSSACTLSGAPGRAANSAEGAPVDGPATESYGAEGWCRLEAEAGRWFGEVARQALALLGDADLVVSHGQTLHHLVEDGRVVGTLQVGDPAWIVEATGRPVVSHVRSADIAAGGQGAPLAGTLDALWLGGAPTALLNLGGIANVTIVGDPAGVVTGDTGPANGLLDAAAQARGAARDDGGRWAAAGRVDEAALAVLLADPFYALPLPRSTGREHFHAGYVAERLAVVGLPAPTGDDLFATLTELTARTVADVLAAYDLTRLVVSGGGAHNPTLLARLGALSGLPVLTTDELGLPGDAKEAYLMALLGWLAVHGQPGVRTPDGGPDGPTVTGAHTARILGSLTPPALVGALADAVAADGPVAFPRRLTLAPQEASC